MKVCQNVGKSTGREGLNESWARDCFQDLYNFIICAYYAVYGQRVYLGTIATAG